MSIISKIKKELKPMYFIAKWSFYVSLGESIAHNIIENFENKEKITNSIIYITNQLDDIMTNTVSHLPLWVLCILSLHSKNISLKNLWYILASISAHFVYEVWSDHNFGEILATATIWEIFAYMYEQRNKKENHQLAK